MRTYHSQVSHETLAKMIGCTIEEVRQSLKELEGLGEITLIDSPTGEPPIYELTLLKGMGTNTKG